MQSVCVLNWNLFDNTLRWTKVETYQVNSFYVPCTMNCMNTELVLLKIGREGRWLRRRRRMFVFDVNIIVGV